MDKEAMKQLILESVSRKLGNGYHISIRKVLKTNLKRDALTILQDGMNCTPNIYLEPFYEELEKGAPIDDVTDSIIQLYLCTKPDVQDFDAMSMADFDHVKKRLYVELINRHSNTELLQDVPHSIFLDDFAVITRCLVNMASDGRTSFLVHDSQLKMWNTDRETLLSTAVQNTRKMFGVNLQNMDEVLGELLNCPSMDGCIQPSIWVLSNRQKLSGAATALFDDVLREFAQTHGSFHAIFSSVHEVLLIPAGQGPDRDLLTKLNQEVNTTQVRQDEILGTKAYFYDREKGFVL